MRNILNDDFDFGDKKDGSNELPIADAAPVAAAPVEDEKPKVVEPMHRQLQRKALTDLVELAQSCTTLEADIERKHNAAVLQTNQAYEHGKSDIAFRYKGWRETVGQKYESRSGELIKQYTTESSAAALADKRARQKADQEHDTVAKDVKQKVQQAIWLADSMLEGTQAQLRNEGKVAKEELENQQLSLDETESKLADLMRTYGQKVPPPSADLPTLPDQVNASELFKTSKAEAEEKFDKLHGLKLPGLFVGVRPYAILFLLVVAAAVGGQVAAHGMPKSTQELTTLQPDFKAIGIAGGAALVVLVGIGIALKMAANKQIAAAYAPLRESMDKARAAAVRNADDTKFRIDSSLAAATKKRELEIRSAKEKFAPVQQKAIKTRDAVRKTLQEEFAKSTSRLNAARDKSKAEVDAWRKKHDDDLNERETADLAGNEQKFKDATTSVEAEYKADREGLVSRWQGSLDAIQGGISVGGSEEEHMPISWSDPAWKKWMPPKKFAEAIRFGELHVDIRTITDQVPQSLEIPPTFAVPALLAFPQHSSMLIETDRAGRADSIRAMQMVMMRLLTSLPAGRLRFTLIDPVGLGQSFSGFMHLGDYDDALVGGRIYTIQEDIDQRLADLTEHMETVIQKYLRNEFATIDDYNAQAGELAEPYRFLVIADFPVNFSAESMAKLASIASTGARCGVYTLIMRDIRQPLPTGSHLEDVEAHSVILAREGDNFVWKDAVFSQFPLTMDQPPSDAEATLILHKVGQGAKDAKRVEVPFELIAPKPEEFWKSDSSRDLVVPVGRLGATRLQTMRFGRGVAQHGLIAGKTGSGKSSLLNAIITNIAMWYEPDQVELYLIDFKKGVEFKTYATYMLPHARAIAVESDREFGLSVLQRLDAELVRRGEMYRKTGAQDLAAYRRSAGSIPMPRQLLIIDEFQEFFSEDDRVAEEARLLLDRLVRQGRAFGIHVLLGSQSLGGAGGLPRPTMGQMQIRVALSCSEADSQLILGDDNSAARLLSRPGEAIYNDQGGLVEANSPFQIAWLGDEQREAYLKRVSQRADETLNGNRNEPIVFEGNAAAELSRNKILKDVLSKPQWPAAVTTPRGWLGDPVAIKDPTAIIFRRQSGVNAMIIGQQDESALAMMVSLMLSIAAQQVPTTDMAGGKGGAIFYVLDGTAADSPIAGTFDKVKSLIPHEVKIVDFRAIDVAMTELEEELNRRQSADLGEAPSIYFFIYGLQRYRALRKSEDSFGGFSMSDDEPKKVDPGKIFADLLREGPTLGIHIITWCDTPATVERTLDRTMLREFDNRILFQMSANDSSNLIDNPAANKLGPNRALAYSEEQGVMEKFRPYGLPEMEFMETVKTAFEARAQGTTAG